MPVLLRPTSEQPQWRRNSTAQFPFAPSPQAPLPRGGDGRTQHLATKFKHPRLEFRCWFVLALCCLSQLSLSPLAAAGPREIQVRRTAEKIRYGVIGEIGKSPKPTLIVVAHGIEEMQRQPVYTEVAAILAPQGWLSVVIEPPCHGEDARPGEPAQLEGWRSRLEHNEEFIPAFTAKGRAILDELIQQKITDVNRIAVCGTSRGGFLAYHLAAADPRIKAAAGFSPVTNLLALHEFAATSHRKQAEQLDVRRLAPKLAGRAIWLSIGNNDARVNTDDSIAFTREVVRASARSEKPDTVIPVELLVAPTPGHSKIDQAHELLAAWLMKHVPPNPNLEKEPP
jgi:dienelactone hydrolase